MMMEKHDELRREQNARKRDEHAAKDDGRGYAKREQDRPKPSRCVLELVKNAVGLLEHGEQPFM